MSKAPEQDVVPAELIEWVGARLKVISAEARRADKVTASDRQEWTLKMIDHASNIEITAAKLVRLLSAYGVRETTATPAAIGRASKVTQTSVAGRAVSRQASEGWAEIWPD